MLGAAEGVAKGEPKALNAFFSMQLRRWVYSRKKRPLSVRHLAVDGLLNFLHNAPSSGRFDKLTNPLDARD